MSRASVVGGGAAGLLAAGFAAGRGVEVTVVERNPRMARKVMITGKGRCNVTNDCDRDTFIAHVPCNGRFLYSCLSAFSPRDTMDLLENLGVPLKTERGGRVFPCSDKAVDVVDALVRFARDAGARFRTGRAVALLLDGDACGGVELEGGGRIAADAVAICTGGLSYPRTGSTGDGYVLARQAGHHVTPLRPSLVPLETETAWCRDLQGLALRNCAVRVTDRRTGREIYRDFGEMLFTHFGVSGPVVLSASAHLSDMEPGRYTLWIDLKPALSHEQLDARLLRELGEAPNARFAHVLGTLLPRRMVPVAAELSGVSVETPCNRVTRAQRTCTAETLKALPVEIAGFRPVEEAVVTSGGVDVKEIDARTMASKRIRGLYFAGEVLDVDAYTGGFNLQIAFSTGAAAGRAL